MGFNKKNSIELKTRVIDADEDIDLNEYHCIKMPYQTTSLTMKFMVTFKGEMSDEVILPGTDCEDDVDLSPSVNLDKEIHDWIKDNVTNCFLDGFNIYFKNEEDAMAFKLKWL